jgi:hypothetical protein
VIGELKGFRVDSIKVRLRAIATRCRETGSRAHARFAASRAGIRWAALAPRTQRIAAAGGAGVLVLVILGALVLGPLSAHGAGGSSSHSSSAPGIAAASGSSAASASASVGPTATVGPPRAAAVLATIACDADWTTPVVSAGRMYVSCSNGTQVIAIDLATDKVAKTYKIGSP